MTNRSSYSALCIGINYRGTSSALEGCIQDAHNIASLLQTNYGYSDVTLLTDDTPIKPTRENILRTVRRLIQSPSSTKTLTFSGHGSNILDQNGDENDRRDETWVSLDFKNIIDDELFEILFLLPKNKTLYIVSDSCHSGTIMDLPYLVLQRRILWNHRRRLPSSNIFCLSGCLDHEYSYETLQNRSVSGVLTSSLLTILRQYPSLPLIQLLQRIQNNINRLRLPQKVLFSSSAYPSVRNNIRFFG